MILATLFGTVFWIIYGFLINGKPVVIMNAIFGIIIAYQLFLKIRHEK